MSSSSLLRKSHIARAIAFANNNNLPQLECQAMTSKGTPKPLMLRGPNENLSTGKSNDDQSAAVSPHPAGATSVRTMSRN
jgi:hypothetical protein